MQYEDLIDSQRAAVDSCVASIQAGNMITRLNGFAGTGKTSIAPVIVEEAGLAGQVVYATPTGKAAAVLVRKGNRAQTIHSLLYRGPDRGRDKEGKPILLWTLDDGRVIEARERAALIVLDESSMVGKKLGNDIMELGIPVLAIGDPMQLQPVNDTQFFMDPEPDGMLTEIVRNKDTVKLLAQDIRKHGVRAAQRYRSISLGRIGQSAALDYSQIIVGRNKTRDLKNRKMRMLRGYDEEELIVLGERIICLMNNYAYRCMNGNQFKVVQIGDSRGQVITVCLECECGADFNGSVCRTCYWDRRRPIPMWKHAFRGLEGEAELKAMDYEGGQKAMMATYGYCITAHKSQGSEWPSVLVINEAWGKEKKNWLYTAVTRAETEVAIISPTGK
jgi:ATP-dependent exoDNAse (exonuclease V) alpha subunit